MYIDVQPMINIILQQVIKQIINTMRLVGQKYLAYTKQFREMHHSLHMGKIQTIMKIQKSNQHFDKIFPQYPIQYTWENQKMPLHAYCWEPTQSKPKAILINFNALNAHTGLSGAMAKSMAQSGIAMTGIDYPNFGKSHSPTPGHIQSIKGLEDLSQAFLQHVNTKYPGVPVYLSGVSMGGLIAFNVGLRRKHSVDGCILMNPAFKDNPINNGFLKKLVMLGGMIFPKFQTMKPIRSHSTKHSLQKYKAVDKLMYSGKVWTSTTWALLSHMRNISKQEHFKQFTLPFLCIQGGSDKILNPFTVFELEKDSRSVDKQIVIIPDLWHAVWFDDHHDQIVEMTKQWILDRVETERNAKKSQHAKNEAHQQIKHHHSGRHVKHPHHHHENHPQNQKPVNK